jgi:hypothetical protein
LNALNSVSPRIVEMPIFTADETKEVNGLTQFNCFRASPEWITCRSLIIQNIDGLVLDELPSELRWLQVEGCNLEVLPELPNTLEALKLKHNRIQRISRLPDSIRSLSFYNNQLTELPNIPQAAQNVSLANNQLTSLPELPENSRLVFLNCSNNPITKLPNMPESLRDLICDSTQLKTIPRLPNDHERTYFYNCPLEEPFATLYKDNVKGEITNAQFAERIEQVYQEMAHRILELRELISQQDINLNSGSVVASFLTGQDHTSLRQQLAQLQSKFQGGRRTRRKGRKQQKSTRKRSRS